MTVQSSHNSYTVAFSLGMKWHLTCIEDSGLSRQPFRIAMTTTSITTLLLCSDIFIMQCQHFSGQLYVSDTAEEISDWCFVEVAVKQVGSDGYMTDALPWWTDLCYTTTATNHSLTSRSTLSSVTLYTIITSSCEL